MPAHRARYWQVNSQTRKIQPNYSPILLLPFPRTQKHVNATICSLLLIPRDAQDWISCTRQHRHPRNVELAAWIWIDACPALSPWWVDGKAPRDCWRTAMCRESIQGKAPDGRLDSSPTYPLRASWVHLDDSSIAFKEPFRSHAVTPLLKKYVNHFPILINSSPQVMLLTAHLDEYFVNKEGVTISLMATPQSSRI